MPIFLIFKVLLFNLSHLFEPGEAFVPHVRQKNIKFLFNSLNQEEKSIEIQLNCKILSISKIAISQLPKIEKLLILRNEIKLNFYYAQN